MSKIKKLISLLPENTECALITSEDNRNFFSGFSASNGTLIVTHEGAFFYIDSRYITAAAQVISDAEVVLQTESFYATLNKFFKEKNIKTASFEAKHTSIEEYALLKKEINDINFDFSGEIDNIILKIRRKKSADEIEKIKRAQAITDECFCHMCSFIKEGMSEKEIQLELDFYLLSHGADALSFETIVVSGENSAKPHGVPSGRKVKKGDFITMDFGAVVDFYHSDMTRTVALGFADEKMKKVYNTVLKAQLAGIEAAVDGALCSAIDKAARTVIENAGFGEYFGHSLGHGVGVEIHEKPNFAPRSEETFSQGDVVTVEPGIYIPGEFGVRIEDMLVNEGSQTLNLTHSPKNLIVL